MIPTGLRSVPNARSCSASALDFDGGKGYLLPQLASSYSIKVLFFFGTFSFAGKFNFNVYEKIGSPILVTGCGFHGIFVPLVVFFFCGSSSKFFCC